jgi:hypothetical protein
MVIPLVSSDHLSVKVLIALEHAQSWPIRRTFDDTADFQLTLIPSFILLYKFLHFNLPTS